MWTKEVVPSLHALHYTEGWPQGAIQILHQILGLSFL